MALNNSGCSEIEIVKETLNSMPNHSDNKNRFKVFKIDNITETTDYQFDRTSSEKLNSYELSSNGPIFENSGESDSLNDYLDRVKLLNSINKFKSFSDKLMKGQY